MAGRRCTYITDCIFFIALVSIAIFCSSLLIDWMLRDYFCPDKPNFNVAFTSATGNFRNISGDDVQAEVNVAFDITNMDEHIVLKA